MKKFPIAVLLVFVMTKMMAQDYLINFEGTGATSTIGTIQVTNLSKCSTITINGADILHLTAPSGIGELSKENGGIQICPNPMSEKSTLAFEAPESGNVHISIIDQNGEVKKEIIAYLSSGLHRYNISGLQAGMYFVSVTGKNYGRSIKLISEGVGQAECKIEVNPESKKLNEKSLKSSLSTINMAYSDGDQLFYKATSAIYQTVVTDIPTSSKTTTFNFVACTDASNNNYSIVQIGAQVWMAQNLNVGTRIDVSSQQTPNGIIEKYCFNNDENNCDVYGGLYQWGEALNWTYFPHEEGQQGICPSGWHLPTNAEWETLTNFLGGEAVAGGKMKETGVAHWTSPNFRATNSSGFTALAAGIAYTGNYYWMTFETTFWSSTRFNGTDARVLCIYNDREDVVPRSMWMDLGFSVRCLKD